MKNFWSEQRYQQYIKSTSFWNYPEIPFGPFLKKIIKPDDIVADIGCGFGVASVYLAQFCRKVYAIDQDSFALQKVEIAAREKGVNNIETICAVWPNFDLGQYDVIVALYHYHFAHQAEKIAKLKEMTGRAGIISCQGTRERESFHLDLKKRLGLPWTENDINCENGCYVKGRLEQAGFQVKCDTVPHDFGQPVDSIEEAALFMIDQLKLDQSYRSEVQRFAQNNLIKIRGQLVIPIKRFNCLLTYYA